MIPPLTLWILVYREPVRMPKHSRLKSSGVGKPDSLEVDYNVVGKESEPEVVSEAFCVASRIERDVLQRYKKRSVDPVASSSDVRSDAAAASSGEVDCSAMVRE